MQTVQAVQAVQAIPGVTTAEYSVQTLPPQAVHTAQGYIFTQGFDMVSSGIQYWWANVPLILRLGFVYELKGQYECCVDWDMWEIFISLFSVIMW